MDRIITTKFINPIENMMVMISTQDNQDSRQGPSISGIGK